MKRRATGMSKLSQILKQHLRVQKNSRVIPPIDDEQTVPEYKAYSCKTLLGGVHAHGQAVALKSSLFSTLQRCALPANE